MPPAAAAAGSEAPRRRRTRPGAPPGPVRPDAGERRRAAIGLRSHVLAPVLSLALPLAVVATIVLALLWREERETLLERHEAAARTVAVAVGREVRQSRERAELLATRPSLPPDEFLRHGDDVLQARPKWRRLVLADAEGRPIVATPAEPGDGTVPAQDMRPLPAALVRRALDERRGVVSDVYAAEDGTPVAAIVVPNGEGPGVLAIELRLDALDALLEDFAHDGGIAVVLDSADRVLARSHEGAPLRGRGAPEALAAELLTSPEGAARVSVRDGPTSDVAWTPVDGTPWRVVVHLPVRPVLATLQHPLALLVGAGLVALAIGVAVALRTGRRLREAIDAIGRGAAALLEGRRGEVAATGTAELDRLGETLRVAAARLREAERQRDELFARESAARAAAEDANRAKDDFLAMLAHELRTPLAPLVTSLRILERHEMPTGPRRDALAIAGRQAGQLRSLVDDLLDASRVARGRVDLARERLSVEEALRCATEAAAPEAAARGHALVVEAPAGPLWIDADRVRVAQMLGNLLANAIKYTPDGGRIVVAAQAVGGVVEMRVTDTGIGLEPRSLARVFELFHQVDAGLERSAGGLGIGLALVERLAVAHGGSVRAESAGRGRGATFAVRLPRLG